MPESRDHERSPEHAAVHRFQNPRSIRALAHPARLAIIDALAAGEELTATQCAELTGLSPSATAYHLKLLERYGFAETAPQRDQTAASGRGERPDAGSRSTWTARRRPEPRPPPPSRRPTSTRPGRIGRRVHGGRATPSPQSGAMPPSCSNVDLWLTVEEFRAGGPGARSGARAATGGGHYAESAQRAAGGSG